MSFPSDAVSTELEAVNQILSSVGQAPVTTLNMVNPEVSIVLSTLREVNRQVQQEGWAFNTEAKVLTQRQADGALANKILYPTNATSVDANKMQHFYKYDIVRRTETIDNVDYQVLYDRVSHSSVFNEDLHLDILYHFDFKEVPPPVQALITAKAARMVAIKLVGDPQINQLLAEQEALARATANEYECNQGDYSIFGYTDQQTYYNSYQPFDALKR